MSNEMWEDPADDEFALPGDEQIVGQQQQQQVAEAEPQETVEGVEEAVADAERPRNEKGQFTKAEEPAPEPEPELILGKFKSADDLAKAYQELESQQGRQSNELGELRQYMEQEFSKFEEDEPEPVNTQSLQEELDANPARIPTVARDAYNRGDDATLYASLVSWEFHDPAGAKQFEHEIAVDRVRREQARQQQAATAREQENRVMMQEFTSAHPDLGAVSSVMQQIVPEYPSIGRMLASQEPKERREALEALYSLASRRASDNATAENQEAAAQNAEAADRAIQEAQVVTGSSTHTETKKSGAELVGEQWDEMDKAVDDGWNL